jgi:MFS family permease
VRLLLLASSVVSFLGPPDMVIMPMFARGVVGWGELGLSLMMGTAGAGALVGALMLAYLGDFQRKALFMLGAAFSGGACIAGFSLAGSPYVSLALLFGVGFSMVGFFAVANMLLQQLVQEEMRGRVMSMWIFAFIGTMPFGSFIAGVAAERFGVRWAVASGGFVIIAFVALAGIRNQRLRELP